MKLSLIILYIIM